MPTTETLANRVARLENRIALACENAGRRRDSVALLAVSKTRDTEEMECVRKAGISRFGENYLDEAAAKQDRIKSSSLEWHFIGPIQSNKTRAIVERFDWVQSVDRRKIVRRLGEQRPDHLGPLNVLLQVNIDREPQKAGCTPEDLEALATDFANFETLKLRGLMTIPSAVNSPGRARAAFSEMRSLFESLQVRHTSVDTLSMGMSGDLEAAIEEGATMVRVGTALFGPRDNAG